MWKIRRYENHEFFFFQVRDVNGPFSTRCTSAERNRNFYPVNGLRILMRELNSSTPFLRVIKVMKRPFKSYLLSLREKQFIFIYLSGRWKKMGERNLNECLARWKSKNLKEQKGKTKARRKTFALDFSNTVVAPKFKGILYLHFSFSSFLPICFVLFSPNLNYTSLELISF